MLPNEPITAQLKTSAPVITPVSARAAVAVVDRGETYFVDTSTGEIFHATRKLPRYPKVRSVDKYVGQDTCWPSQARDQEELLEATKPFDYWPDEHYINKDKMLDLLDRAVSANAVRLLRYLAEHLSGRNHWFGRMNEIADALPMPTRTLERAMQELSDINVVRSKKQGRLWPLRVSVHPWFAWKGDLQGRDGVCAQWLGIRAAKFDGN